MSKVKLALIAAAISFAIVGAFATKPSAVDCRFQPQYRLLNGNFVPAGQYGTTYLCWDIGGVCTYVKTGSTYTPCQEGVYIPLN